MQPRDYFRRQKKDVPTSSRVRHNSKNLHWLISGGVLLVFLLLLSWLLNTGLSSLLLPMYPEVIVVLPKNEATNISTLAVLIFHQDAHRTSGHLLSLKQPLVITGSNDQNLARELSLKSGLMVNRVILLPEDSINQRSLPRQFWGLIKSNWQRPQLALNYVKLVFITPVLDEVTISDFADWGREMAKRVRPLETRAQECSIGVSNTIGLSGLGKQYANFLAQQGATVRRVTNASLSLPASQILVDETSRNNCLDTVPVLGELFSNQVPITHQTGVIDQYRVPLMILLGSDSTKSSLLTIMAQE